MTNSTNHFPAADRLGYDSFYVRWVPEPVTEDLQAYVDAVLPFVYLEDSSGYARTGSGPLPG